MSASRISINELLTMINQSYGYRDGKMPMRNVGPFQILPYATNDFIPYFNDKDGTLVIAFRGTLGDPRGIKDDDLKADLQIITNQIERSQIFKRGIADARRIITILASKQKVKKIVLTGHSLGGFKAYLLYLNVKGFMGIPTYLDVFNAPLPLSYYGSRDSLALHHRVMNDPISLRTPFGPGVRVYPAKSNPYRAHLMDAFGFQYQ